MDPDGDALYTLDDPDYFWIYDDRESGVAPQPDDEVLIFGERRPPRSEMDVLMDELYSGFLESTHPIFGPAIVESKRRAPLVGELLEMSPRQQRRAVRRRPYRDLVLANRLLDESTQFAVKRPDEAERCAVLAEWIANQPWPDEPGKAASVLLSALLAQGNVLRLRRDWKKAELRFAAAYSLLRGREAHIAHSTFCSKLSQLRADQGRYDEATLLHMYSMSIDSMLWGSNQISMGDLYRLAIFALKQNDLSRAMAILTHLVLNQESHPYFGYFSNEIDLGRAICMAAIGDADAARSLIAEALPKWRNMEDRTKSILYEWLECRIAIYLEDLDRAVPRLEAIRRRLIAEGDLGKICLCSIDLALAYAKQGRAAERLPSLLADIAQRPGAAERPWALGSLWRFREALNRRRDPAAAAREAAEIVHRREMSLKKLAAYRYPAKA